MPASCSLPTLLHTAVFSTRTARDHGVMPARLRASDIDHPFHGVNATAPLDDVRALCEAYVARGIPDQWFSHLTAAALYGIPLPPSARAKALHVVVAYPRTPPRTRQVIGHSVRDLQAEIIEGMPVCGPAQVWCQLSTILDRDELVVAGDFLVGARSRAALSSVEELSAASMALRGRAGAPKRAWALPRIRFGADSRPESLLRLLLQKRGYTNVLVNQPVEVGNDRLVLHPDLMLPDQRVLLEYEGDGHRTGRRQWQSDIARVDLLESAGWRVVRVTSADLFENPTVLLDRVASAARRIVRFGDPAGACGALPHD